MEQPRRDRRVQTLFLEHLPTEMLEEVFILLPLKDLATIATSSRRFNDIVEPYLYSRMHITLPALTTPYRNTQLPEYEATMVTFEIEVVYHTKWQYRDQLPSSYECFNRLITKLGRNQKLSSRIKSICFRSEGPAWYEQVAKQILDLAPSLQGLSFRGYGPPIQLVLPMSSALSILRLDMYDSRGHFNDVGVMARMLAGCLFIPSLQTLQVDAPIFCNDIPIFTVQKRRSAPLVDLQLLSCDENWTGTNLPQVILSARHLQRLVYERRCEWQTELIGWRLITEVQVAIPEHSDSIEEMIIANTDAAYRHLQGQFCVNLVGFAKLKRLAIPLSFLPEMHSNDLHRQLPESLEVLQLEYSMDNEKIDARIDQRMHQLQRLAQAKAAHLPRLSSVTWWYQQRASQLPADSDDSPIYGAEVALKQLTLDFEKVGVNFEWVSTPALKDTPMGRPLDITYSWSRDLPRGKHYVDELGRVRLIYRS